MATMIPDTMSANPGNETERAVFGKLQEGPKEWVVLHSVKVPQGSGRNDREIDFVILTGPSVICLEVKGGRYARRDNQWFYANRKPADDPTEQARSAMFALKNYAERELPVRIGANLKSISENIRYEYALLLTNPAMAGIIPEPDDWLLLDYNSCQDATSLNDELAKFASATLRKAPRQVRNQLTSPVGAPLVSQVQDKLRELLTPPDFDGIHIRVSKGNLNQINRELLKLTEQQAQAFRASRNNDRVVVDGAAGTGKTILALGLARERAEAGERVLFVVGGGNENLVQWIRKQDLPSNIEITAQWPLSLTSYLVGENTFEQRRFAREYNKIANHYQYVMHPHGFIEERWQNLRGAFEKAADRLAEDTVSAFAAQDGKPPFEYLVVDEAQRIASSWCLKLVDTLLTGGLVRGNWTMFGDFANQNTLSGPAGKTQLRDELRRLYQGISWTSDRLTTNCRNARPVFEAFAGLATPDSYEIVPEWQVNGPEVSVRYFANESGMGTEIDRAVDKLRGHKVPAQQIILLGLYASFGQRLGNDGVEYGGWQICDISRDYAKLSSARLNYCYYVDFQGLESEVIIVVLGRSGVADAETVRKILYTTLSRARGYLIVIAHESHRALLEQSVRR